MTEAVSLRPEPLLTAPIADAMLRHSPRARRQFVTLQHRHPRFIFPVRRLIRREPEVFPVAWQQLLRIERMMLPHSWRRAGHWRRRYFRAKR